MARPSKTKIVLGVTGSIAAYKAAELARYFMKRGCIVRVIMSEAAERFISALTFESITGQPVLRSFWDETQPGAIGHIALADWADAVVVAPASADFIAKAAHGFAESPLLAVLLATKAPVVIAPAMNVNMLSHAQTQANISRLTDQGVTIVDTDSGMLACGWRGKGRLAEASEVYFQTRRAMGPQDLRGKRILISTGPTREALDPVRFLSNRSSGKMGLALAREAYRRGGYVTVVHGPLTGSASLPKSIDRIPVTSAIEMHDALLSKMKGSGASSTYDVVIMAAAVADFRPESVATEKIKKASNPSSIRLTPNPDILKELGEVKGSSPKPFLVGFAVETGDIANLTAEVRRKRSSKNADLIVGNFAGDSFDKDTNRVWLATRDSEVEIPTARKSRIARAIFDTIVNGVR